MGIKLNEKLVTRVNRRVGEISEEIGDEILGRYTDEVLGISREVASDVIEEIEGAKEESASELDKSSLEGSIATAIWGGIYQKIHSALKEWNSPSDLVH